MLSPSYMLHRLCVHSLPCTTRPWGRAMGDGHHPFIRLHHTGRAHPARLKRDTHFQGYAAGVSSTCHAGLLAPEARGVHGVAHFGVVPREIRPRTWVAVVFVEYLSRTLSASWQLCRKCNATALWCPTGCGVIGPLLEVSCLEEVLDQAQKPVIVEAFPEDGEEELGVNFIEAARDIALDEPSCPIPRVFDRVEGGMAPAMGTEAIGVVAELRLVVCL